MKLNMTLWYALGGLVTVILSYNALNCIEHESREMAVDNLSIILDGTVDIYTYWVEEQKNACRRVTSNWNVQASAELLFEAYANQDSASLLRELSIFSKLKDMFLTHSGAINIELVTVNGRIISEAQAISEPMYHEGINKYPELFQRAVETNNIVFIPPTKRHNTDSSFVFFLAPLSTIGSEPSCLMSFTLPAEGEFTRIAAAARLGESGETYLTNQRGYLVSESRFVDHLIELGLLDSNSSSVNNILVVENALDTTRTQSRLTKMAESVIRGMDSNSIEGYKDYRGVYVLGAWTWIDSLNCGITTEIDESEALRSYYPTRTIYMLTVAYLLAFAIASVYLNRKRRR